MSNQPFNQLIGLDLCIGCDEGYAGAAADLVGEYTVPSSGGGSFGSEVGIDEFTKNLMRISREFHRNCMHL